MANQCKEHNVEKYIQWVAMLLLTAVVPSQICENSNIYQLKVIDLDGANV